MNSKSIPADVVQILGTHGQEHLVKWWNTLTDSQCHELADQIRSIDFHVIASALTKDHAEVGHTPTVNRADIARAPGTVVRQPALRPIAKPGNEHLNTAKSSFHPAGFGVITVAGGQGSRLGFEHPKGMFPIGPLSQRSLFQIFAEQIQARNPPSQYIAAVDDYDQ